MLKATAGKVLPATVIGSLPRPRWYTENLGSRTFLDAMVDIEFRDQYVDALTVFIHQQELAGLDIVTDGDARFDHDVGGQSWTRYPTQHMSGFDHDNPVLAKVGAGGIRFPRGHLLHDYMEARVMPKVIGPIGRGDLQYTEMWKTAQRLTTKPVKFGTVTPEIVGFAVQDEHYKDMPSRTRPAIAEPILPMPRKPTRIARPLRDASEAQRRFQRAHTLCRLAKHRARRPH